MFEAGYLNRDEIKEIEVLPDKVEKFRLRSGDVLMTEGGDRDKLGRGTIWHGHIEGCIHQNHVFRVRPDHRRLLPEYLNLYLGTIEAKGYFLRSAKQTTGIASINLTQLGEFPVVLPPLPEQRRIAAILDKADAIRRKREEGIRLTEELLRSTFLEMFGDPATNPKKWTIATIEDALSASHSGMRCGPFGTALSKVEYVSGGVPVWGIENVKPNLFKEDGSLFITEDKYEELVTYLVSKGDVLISRAGTVGRMCVARPSRHPSIIGTNLIRVSLDKRVMEPGLRFTAAPCSATFRTESLRSGQAPMKARTRSC